jgi:hypothetical protein
LDEARAELRVLSEKAQPSKPEEEFNRLLSEVRADESTLTFVAKEHFFPRFIN